jgi:hypothetical protein
MLSKLFTSNNDCTGISAPFIYSGFAHPQKSASTPQIAPIIFITFQNKAPEPKLVHGSEKIFKPSKRWPYHYDLFGPDYKINV